MSSTAILTATVQALRDALDVEVFSYVPESAVLPYVTVGEAVQSPFDAHDHIGFSMSFAVNTWTRDERGGPMGPKVGLDLDALVDLALTHADLETADGRAFHLYPQSMNMLEDNDPQIRRVRREFRTFLQR